MPGMHNQILLKKRPITPVSYPRNNRAPDCRSRLKAKPSALADR